MGADVQMNSRTTLRRGGVAVRSLVPASAAALFLILTGCRSGKPAPIQDLRSEEPFDRSAVVATVDGYDLSAGELANAFAEIGAFDQLWQRARARNETSYLIDFIHNIEDARVFAERAWEKNCVDGKQMEAFIDRLRFDEITNLYYVREILLNVDVTERELREYYDQVKGARFAIPRRIKIRWIFISRDKWGWEEAEKRAKEVRSLLEGKKEFEELVYTYSDSTSPQRLGDFGWYKMGDLESNPAFQEAVFSMKKVGEHVGPIRARNGFHFAKLSGVQEEEVVSYENSRLVIRDELVQAKVEKRLAELVEQGRNTMTVERNFDLLDQPDAPDDAFLFRVNTYRYPLGRFRRIALAQGLDHRDAQVQYLEKALREAIVHQFAIEAGYGRLDIERLFKAVIDRHLQNVYLQCEVDDQVDVSEAEILKYYEENRKALVSETRIHPYWILIRADVPADAMRYQKEIAMHEAKNQADQLFYGLIHGGGEPFTDLARKYSDHEPSRIRGGDLGLYAGASLGHRFDEVAFGMEPGQISQPVELSNGYCIIWMREKFPSRPLTYDEAHRSIQEGIRQRKIDQRRRELREAARQERDIIANDELLKTVAGYLVRAHDDLIIRARLIQ